MHLRGHGAWNAESAAPAIRADEGLVPASPVLQGMLRNITQSLP